MGNIKVTPEFRCLSVDLNSSQSETGKYAVM